jgi:hypothetical protein
VGCAGGCLSEAFSTLRCHSFFKHRLRLYILVTTGVDNWC